MHGQKHNAEGGPLTDGFCDTQQPIETKQLPLLFSGLPNQPTGGPLIRKDRPSISYNIDEEMGQFTDPQAASMPPSNT